MSCSCFVVICVANDKVRTDKGHRRPFALSLVRILRSANVYSADDFACGVQHREQKGQTARKSVVSLIFTRRDIASSDIHKRRTRMGVRFELRERFFLRA